MTFRLLEPGQDQSSSSSWWRAWSLGNTKMDTTKARNSQTSVEDRAMVQKRATTLRFAHRRGRATLLVRTRGVYSLDDMMVGGGVPCTDGGMGNCSALGSRLNRHHHEVWGRGIYRDGCRVVGSEHDGGPAPDQALQTGTELTGSRVQKIASTNDEMRSSWMREGAPVSSNDGYRRRLPLTQQERVVPGQHLPLPAMPSRLPNRDKRLVKAEDARHPSVDFDRGGEAGSIFPPLSPLLSR